MAEESKGCKRCSLHGLDYPLYYNWCMVTGCEEGSLSYIPNGNPDPDFKEIVETYNRVIEDNEDEPDPMENVIVGLKLINPDCVHLGELAIADAQVNPAHHADKLWVAHEDLIKAGYLFLEDFQVVMLKGKFYELQAHVGRASLTHGIRGGAWWIEEIDPDTITCPDTYDYIEEVI